MTEKELFEQALSVAEKNQSKGRKVLSFMYAINDRKLRGAIFTQSDLLAILDNIELQKIERLLLNGSIETARSLIMNLVSSYYTQADKDIILGVIDNEIFESY